MNKLHSINREAKTDRFAECAMGRMTIIDLAHG